MVPRTIIADAVACALASHGTATAQDWPARPMTMVAPFAAGGGNDVLGRIIAQPLSEILRQPVIIENVPGLGE